MRPKGLLIYFVLIRFADKNTARAVAGLERDRFLFQGRDFGVNCRHPVELGESEVAHFDSGFGDQLCWLRSTWRGTGCRRPDYPAQPRRGSRSTRSRKVAEVLIATRKFPMPPEMECVVKRNCSTPDFTGAPPPARTSFRDPTNRTREATP